MKRLLSSLFCLLCSLLLISPVSALKVDIQVEKTAQTPGYLAFTIFPPKEDKEAQSLILDEVYIQNYAPEDAEKYQELTELILEFGGKIFPPQQAENWYQKPYTRVIVLGEHQLNVKGDLYFIPTEKDFENVTEAFVSFARDYLQPAYLQNISIEGADENFESVYPEYVAFLGEEPITFVGKFKEKRPMNVILQAIGPDEILQAKIKVDIENTALINNRLPQLWSELQKEPLKGSAKSVWFNLFPLVLGAFGVLFLLIAFGLRKKEKLGEESLPMILSRFHDTIDEETLPFDLDYHSREQRHKAQDK
ncbi:MAG TPA: hypothetical protein VIT68_03705 [Candidatus Gracilibacteria bacterium]